MLAEREKEYVEAVRALGATRLVVALKHVLPNVLSPFVVQGTVAFSQAILIEASLSYLGLSAQPPTPSWGNMLNEGRTYLETAPWISVFPGIAIMVAVLAFNLIGDGLRDVLDPERAVIPDWRPRHEHESTRPTRSAAASSSRPAASLSAPSPPAASAFGQTPEGRRQLRLGAAPPRRPGSTRSSCPRSRAAAARP